MSLTSVGQMIEDAFKDDACKIHFKLIQMILTILAKRLRLLDRRVAVALGDLPYTPVGSQLSITEVKIKGKKKKHTMHDSSSSSSSYSGKSKGKRPQDLKRKQESRLHKYAKPEKQQEYLLYFSFQPLRLDYHIDKEKSRDKSLQRRDRSAMRDKILDISSDDSVAMFTDKYKRRSSSKSEKETKSAVRSSPETVSSSEGASGKRKGAPVGGRAVVQGGRKIPGADDDYHQEKLIIVEPASDDNIYQLPQSVVTMEEFSTLASRVAKIEKLYETKQPELDENKDMMQELQKELTLSDPMALIQLSSRLEKAEQNLGSMLSVLAELASRTPGVLEAVGPIIYPNATLARTTGTEEGGIKAAIPKTQTTKSKRSDSPGVMASKTTAPSSYPDQESKQTEAMEVTDSSKAKGPTSTVIKSTTRRVQESNQIEATGVTDFSTAKGTTSTVSKSNRVPDTRGTGPTLKTDKNGTVSFPNTDTGIQKSGVPEITSKAKITSTDEEKNATLPFRESTQMLEPAAKGTGVISESNIKTTGEILGTGLKMKAGAERGTTGMIDRTVGRKDTKAKVYPADKAGPSRAKYERARLSDLSIRSNLTDILQRGLKKDLVNGRDLGYILQDFADDFNTSVGPTVKRASYSSATTNALLKKLDNKITDLTQQGETIDDIEDNIYTFVERVNDIDSEFSGYITEYQEGLTAMQYDLEECLDNVAEALASQEGDPEAVADLNFKMSLLGMDLDKTLSLQHDLGSEQKEFRADLKSLWLQINLLNQTKCNRDEVKEKLKEKAGIDTLNGMLTSSQFNAVRGDLQKRIALAYDTFNNTETIWQKVIEELIDDMNDRAETRQLEFLTSDIKRNIDGLLNRINFMMDVAGGVRNYEGDRKIYRDRKCLTCGTPVEDFLDMPELKPLPPVVVKRTSLDTAKREADLGPQDSGDYICYRGKPIPHPIDRRATICPKICGGPLPKHPKATTSQSKSSIKLFGDQLGKKEIARRVYSKPCIPCKLPAIPSSPQLLVIKTIDKHKCVADCYPGPDKCACSLDEEKSSESRQDSDTIVIKGCRRKL